MDQVLLVALAAALVGLAVLAGVAEATEPKRVPLSEVPRHADRTVVVEGRLVAVEPLKSGSTRISLSDDNRSLAAFVHGPVAALPGDRVEATGRVAKYHGQWELVVDEADDVRVSAGWAEDRVPLAELAQEPWRRLDTHVRTAGVFAPEGRAQWLEDRGTGHRMRLSAADTLPLEVLLRVDGLVEYDPDENAFRLRVHDAAQAEA